VIGPTPAVIGVRAAIAGGRAESDEDCACALEGDPETNAAPIAAAPVFLKKSRRSWERWLMGGSSRRWEKTLTARRRPT